MDVSISISADEHTDTSKDGSEAYAYGFDRAHVSMPGEARCNGDEETGAEYRCAACNLPLVDYGNGRDQALGAPRWMGDDECAENPLDTPTEASNYGPHDPQAIPGSFANSASISVGEYDEVTVTISVGDPRGAFAMTVDRMDDGTLRLSVPDPSDGFAHMPLTQIMPGMFKQFDQTPFSRGDDE